MKMLSNASANVSSLAFEETRLYLNIEAVYLCCFFALGLLINCRSVFQFVRSKKMRHKYRGRLVQLGIHLIAANLILLTTYCFPKMIWLLSFWWYGGDSLCKLYSFFAVFSFQLCSNVVAAIAIDTCYCIWAPLQARAFKIAIIRRLVGGSWVLAAVCAAPQLLLRGTLMVQPPDRIQCYFWYLGHVQLMFAYGIFHTITVFYAPLAVILTCYTISVLKNGHNIAGNIRRFSEQAQMMGFSRFSGGRNSSAASIRRYPTLSRQQWKLLKTSSAVVGTYVLTWLPYQSLAIWKLLCNPEAPCGGMIERLEWLEAAMLMSTCITPFLYQFKEKNERPSIQNPVEAHRSLLRKKSRAKDVKFESEIADLAM